jgi:hypothetical protein
MKMRFVAVGTLLFWIANALPALGSIYAGSNTKGQVEQQPQRKLVESLARILGFVWIDIANPKRQVRLNESVNNFDMRDFPKGATVQALTSEGVVGKNDTVIIKSMLFRQRPDCFINTARGYLNFDDNSGQWYMCGSSTLYPYYNVSTPRTCGVFSHGPLNDTTKYCFTVTAHSDYGAGGVTLDAKSLTLNIYGASSPSYVFYSVKPVPRPWRVKFDKVKEIIRNLLRLPYEPLRAYPFVYQGRDNTLSRGDLRRINLQLSVGDDGWAPASVVFNYDNGTMVHLDNDRPFELWGDNSSKSSKDFYFTPSVGTHTITATLFSERNAKGASASISHTVSFRLCRRLIGC